MDIAIESYAKARELFSKAKNKDRGRPVFSYARILAGEGNTLRLLSHGHEIGLIQPDNTFTFTMNINEARSLSNTLSIGLYALIGIHWMRVDTRRYKLIHNNKTKKLSTRFGNEYVDWISARESGQEYFNGLTIDLNSGEIVNPRPDRTSMFDPDKRKVWLHARKKFMRHIKTLGKLGVLESMARSKDSNKLWEHRVQWLYDGALAHLADCMKTENYPHELIDQLVGHVFSARYGRVDDQYADFIKTQVLDKYSVELREQFGVFGETPDDNA